MRIDIYTHAGDEFAIALNQFKGEIMSKLDELKDAVAGVDSNATAGFAAVSDALTELASDVSGLNQKIADLTAQVDNPDLQPSIDALKAESQRISDAATTAAQAIRDAIPTATPGPPTEPTPEPVQ